MLADINPKTFNIDVESARSKVTAKTKAIFPELAEEEIDYIIKIKKFF